MKDPHTTGGATPCAVGMVDVPPTAGFLAITFDKIELFQCGLFHYILCEITHWLIYNIVIFKNIKILASSGVTFPRECHPVQPTPPSDATALWKQEKSTHLFAHGKHHSFSEDVNLWKQVHASVYIPTICNPPNIQREAMRKFFGRDPVCIIIDTTVYKNIFKFLLPNINWGWNTTHTFLGARPIQINGADFWVDMSWVGLWNATAIKGKFNVKEE